MNWKPLATLEIDEVHGGRLPPGLESLGTPREADLTPKTINPSPRHTVSETLAPQRLPAALSATGPVPEPRRRPIPGEQFGRYEILDRLGEGGMGAVYKALDTRLQRDVALKIPLGATDHEHERFRREATAMARFRHPNVCPIHDCGDVDGVPYIAMAFIEGRTLSAVARERLPVPESVRYVLEIARALAEAHREGIVHRDLKPENVMIDRDGNPVVMDFGLARKMLDDDPRLTVDGMALGTPHYMSPEQAGGRVDLIGPPSDVFSLGSLFYELLTGEVPFEGNLATVLRRVREERPQPPSKRRPDVDPALDALVLRMMTIRIADRPTMAEVVTTLQRWLEDPSESDGADHTRVEPITTPVPAATEPVAARSRRGAGTPLVVVGVVLLLGVAIGKWWSRIEGVVATWTTAASPAQSAAAGDRRAMAFRPIRRFEDQPAAVRDMAFSPDGRSLFSAGEDGTVRQWDLASGREIRQFEHSEHPISSIDVSDDGWRLVAGGADGTVTFWDTHSGRLLKRLDGHAGPVEDVDLSPDGRRLVTAGSDDRALLHDLSTGKTVGALSRTNGDLVDVQFDETGTARALVRRGDGIVVHDVATGATKLETAGTGGSFTPDGRQIVVRSDEGGLVLRGVDEAEGRRIDLPGLTGTPRWATTLQQGRYLAAITAEGAFGIWDLTTQKAVVPPVAGWETVSEITISPNGVVAAVDGKDVLHVWSLQPVRT